MGFKCEWDGSFYSSRLTGPMDAQSMGDAFKQAYSDPRSDEIEFALIDLSRVTKVNLSENDTNFAAAQDVGRAIRQSEAKGGVISRYAFVAVSDSVTRFIEQYKKAVMEAGAPIVVEIFRDKTKAKKWLRESQSTD